MLICQVVEVSSHVIECHVIETSVILWVLELSIWVVVVQ
jgi:hypothetical protein